jgi:8-oxo-dGTP diphosphatase
MPDLIKSIIKANNNKIIFYWHPGIILENIQLGSIYGFCLNKDKKVVLTRDKGEIRFTLPGGGVKNGETAKQALIREFKEELGCDIYITNYIGQASMYYFSDVFNHYRHPVGFFFIVEIIAQKNVKAIEEDQTLLWMNPKDCIKHMLKHQAWAVSEALKYREQFMIFLKCEVRENFY